jgi:hypothetical protein
MGQTKLAQVCLLLQHEQFDRLNAVARATGKKRMDLIREGVAYVLSKYSGMVTRKAKKANTPRVKLTRR